MTIQTLNHIYILYKIYNLLMLTQTIVLLYSLESRLA